MRKSKTFLVIGIAIFGLYAFSSAPQSGEWVVPANYKSMANPTDPADEDGLEVGEELYMQHCKSCHGKEGLGDGPKAADQNGELGDFTDEAFQAQSDGSIFYKTKEGRDDMPGYAKKMPDDEDIWMVINFVRTLGE